MRKFLAILIIGISMNVQSQEPEWVTHLRAELGDEIMSKSAVQLTADDIFKIVHVTKNINGADDGVWPMVEMNLPKIKELILNKLDSGNVNKEEMETIHHLSSIFFSEDSDIQGKLEN